MIRPWHLAGAFEHLTIEFVDLPEGELGKTCHITNTIRLQRGMRQRQRRAVLLHELAHWLRRGVEDDDHLEAVEEREVERMVAEVLMPTDRLVDALLWSQNEHELAEYFHIDVATVRDRLKHMSRSEMDYIDQEIRRREA